MRLIGFGARARVGKDTAGNYLKDKYNFICHSFANQLKVEASQILDLDFYNDQVKIEFRDFLIALGQAHRQINPDHWLNLVRDEIMFSDYPNHCITDVRYPNEADWIKSQGGIVVCLNRQTDIHLPSESVMDDYPFDFTIDNNGTIEHLYKQIEEVLHGSGD